MPRRPLLWAALAALLPAAAPTWTVAGHPRCDRKTPLCADPAYRIAPQPGGVGCPPAGVALGRVSPGSGWASWHYVRAATSGPLGATVEVQAAAAGAVRWAAWGPFHSPEACGSALQPLVATNASSGNTAQLSFNTTAGRYYVLLLQLLAPAGPPTFIVRPGGGSLDCALMAAWPTALLYTQQAAVRMAFEGTAFQQFPTGWRLSVPGGSVGTVDCVGTAGPSLAVERQAAVVDTRAWAGLVELCLWPPHNATHHAVLVRVVDWALQSATLGAGRPGTLKVVGLQARSSPFVAILPATADCVESAATAALRVDVTAALVPVPQVPGPPGAYQVCLQPYGVWGSGLAVNASVLPAEFFIRQPLSHTAGQAVVTVGVGGPALAASAGAVFLTNASACSLAATVDARLLDANAAVQLDLSSRYPGQYLLCLVSGSSSTPAWSDVLQVVGFQANPTLLYAAPQQRVSFSGSLLLGGQGAVALLTEALSCADANDPSNVALELAPRPGTAMDADLSAVLPGRYRWCWRAQGPYSEGFEVAVAVLPPRVTVQPATVLQSMRAEFRFEGWRGAGPVLSAQLVANTTDCAALPPAHVTGNPTVYVARDLPTVWMDLTDTPAGVYHFCLHASIDSNGTATNLITVLDEAVDTLYVSRGAQLLEFSSTASPWLAGATVAALPWDRSCSADAVSATVVAAVATNSAGGQTVTLDFSLVPSQDVRLCLKGTTWPYNAYQDGLELAVRITGTFALGSALYTQSPGIDLQAQGTALTGAGDFVAVFTTPDCLTANAPLLRTAVGAAANFTTLAAGGYTACLQPGGVATAGLAWPFTVLALRLAGGAVAYATPAAAAVAGGAAGSVAAVALLPRQYGCSAAPAALVQSPGRISFETYLPGDYQLCLRTSTGAQAAFQDGLACPLQLLPALAVTPGVVARSHAATLSLAVANVTVAAGRAALVWHTQSCAADAVASPLAAAPSAPNGSYVFDLSGAPAGQYRVCHSPDGQTFPEARNAPLNVTLLRLATNQTVPSASNVTVPLAGCPANAGVGQAAVVGWQQSCAAAAQSAMMGPVANCTALLDLSRAGGGWQRLCYRAAGEAFRAGAELLLDVQPTPALRYSPTYLLAGWQQPVVVQGQGLDLQPGADAVRVVLNTSTCAGGPALLDVADLGPQNLSSTAFASVALQLGGTGSVAVCYWHQGSWQRLDPPLTVLPSVADFTGQQSPLLVAGQPQTLRFTLTTAALGTTRRALLDAAAGDVVVAIAPAALAAQSATGGCDSDRFVVGPTPLQGGSLSATFPAAGGYVLCQLTGATWQPVAVFQVSNAGCGPSLVVPYCPVCRKCDILWIWLWPLILAAIMGLLLVPCLCLLVRRKSAMRRGARSGWAAAVLDPAGVWQAVCGGPDPVAEQTARLAEDVRQSRWELKALRTAAGPTEVRRIEVPVDRVVYVPVVEVRPKEVVVERLEEVEVIKTVQRHIVREVEKEVFQDRLVVDPAAQRALEWARQDIELLKSELAAKTQELRDAKQQLSRMPPSPALPALPGPPL